MKKGRRLIFHISRSPHWTTLGVGRSPVVPGDERSLAVVGAVLVVLAVRLEELGEGGGRPLGLAHQDVRDGGPLHRSLPAFSKYYLIKLWQHEQLRVCKIV